MKNTQLDITKEHCPMTFVKTKIALEALEPGDTLELLVLSGEPLDNIPRSAKAEGHKILAVEQVEGDVHKIIIEKAG
ncbi:MAG: sulfurtransferase TusA family protein [Spirochaetaceae bacterium]|jgi:TusA-related sulfurtransferase|nr:sulfurtransferase TusA family protein [Spirochaetaceae bacterium]